MVKNKTKESIDNITTFANVRIINRSLSNTKAILNQAVADLYTARVVVRQVHWYMRGRGFLIWHPKMDEYMTSLDGYLDAMGERLITLGGAPFSSFSEFAEHTKIEESRGSFDHTVEESLEQILVIYRYLAGLFQEGIEVTDDEGDDVTNSIFIDAKTDIEKTVWMLTAELGQAPGL